MGYMKEDGTWHDTCLDKLRPGEPFFVLRAQDLTADSKVDDWAHQNEQLACPAWKIKEARDTAAAMRKWEDRKYPD